MCAVVSVAVQRQALLRDNARAAAAEIVLVQTVHTLRCDVREDLDGFVLFEVETDVVNEEMDVCRYLLPTI